MSTAWGALASLQVLAKDDGAPVNGVDGVGASPGALLIDTTNFTIYMNTGTADSPVWTLATGSTVLAGVTPGTAAASKAVVLDANKDVAGIRNLTVTALIVGTTGISEAEIGVLDGVTPGTAAASKAVVLDANKDVATIRNLTATKVTAGIVFPAADPHVAGVWWDNAGTLTKSAG